jgi:hypothetical protein
MALEQPDDQNVVFHDVSDDSGKIVERIGCLESGTIVLRSKLDADGRVIEKSFYNEAGMPIKVAKYRYDADQQPRLVEVFDKTGRVIFRHERGKKPECF